MPALPADTLSFTVVLLRSRQIALNAASGSGRSGRTAVFKFYELWDNLGKWVVAETPRASDDGRWPSCRQSSSSSHDVGDEGDDDKDDDDEIEEAHELKVLTGSPGVEDGVRPVFVTDKARVLRATQ